MYLNRTHALFTIKLIPQKGIWNFVSFTFEHWFLVLFWWKHLPLELITLFTSLRQRKKMKNVFPIFFFYFLMIVVTSMQKIPSDAFWKITLELEGLEEAEHFFHNFHQGHKQENEDAQHLEPLKGIFFSLTQMTWQILQYFIKKGIL